MSTITTAAKPVVAPGIATPADRETGNNSAVSWAAIFAGAAGAAALSLILVILGTGLGFSAVSPWRTEGVSASKIGFAAIAWLSFTQIAASGMGGYLAGRLRTKWTAVHSDEVYFRDTAHGFLTWAVATLLTAAVFTSVIGAVASAGVRAGADIAGTAAAGTAVVSTASSSAAMPGQTGNDDNGQSNTLEYYVDALFRAPASGSRGQGAEATEIPADEVMRIFVRALRTETLPQEDQRYIAQLIAQHTDISQQEAQQRVASGFEQAQTTLKEAEDKVRQAADEARKASAYTALWMFVALMMGAFIASLMAVFGGRQRDV
ncbi:hypothetical protein SAMN05660691_01241 [Rheinheimera pacifica]|uniref:Transmembrane protein n=1 Tax=Rheinheimera pacifica TaxID=173990 RepID=A0A1H6KHM7_9GAMM|nr:hypothetical protein [Rheinheimera pacifica]SEH75047.1 hypothetical protein SAMN05660691_01241 [Rheinheimera pacifica]